MLPKPTYNSSNNIAARTPSGCVFGVETCRQRADTPYHRQAQLDLGGAPCRWPRTLLPTRAEQSDSPSCTKPCGAVCVEKDRQGCCLAQAPFRAN